MNEDKTIIRKAKDKENPYVMIAKDTVQDKKLTWKETGLLCYLLSLPDNWQLKVQDLINRKIDGRYATRGIIQGLLKKGYLEKIIYRKETGAVIRHEYIVHEKPIKDIQDKPKTVFLATFHKPESSKVVAILNTDSTNNDVPDKMIQYHDQHNQIHDQALRADVEAAGLTWTPNMTRH